MVRAIIFTNGKLGDPDSVRPFLKGHDFIIAADNGAAHCKRLNIQPHVIIGDMDSVDPALLAEYEKNGVQVIRHPAEKNETDLELALFHAKALGAKEIVVFGIVGDRWDMTLANAVMLSRSTLKGISIRAINGSEELKIIHAGSAQTISGNPGDTVSLIPLSESAEGITLEGFRYPLKNENLPLGSGRGMSNELLGNEGLIEFENGVLLGIVTRRNASH